MSSDAKPEVGIVGLGQMGGAIARRMVEAGLPVVGYDIRPEAVEALVGAGAKGADSLSDLGVTQITSIVAVNDEQVTAIGLELIGILQPGATIIVHSTVRPATVVQLADAGAELGVAVIDVAVSGGAAGAEKGALTLMVGGAADVIERCKTVLDAIGITYHVGDTGRGQAMKLLNNMMQAAHQAFAVEAFRIGDALGIDERLIREVALVSSGACWSLENLEYLDGMLEGHTIEDREQVLDFMAKEPWSAVVLAKEAGVHVPALWTLSASMHDIYGRRLDKVRAQLHP